MCARGRPGQEWVERRLLSGRDSAGPVHGERDSTRERSRTENPMLVLRPNLPTYETTDPKNGIWQRGDKMDWSLSGRTTSVSFHRQLFHPPPPWCGVFRSFLGWRKNRATHSLQRVRGALFCHQIGCGDVMIISVNLMWSSRLWNSWRLFPPKINGYFDMTLTVRYVISHLVITQ